MRPRYIRLANMSNYLTAPVASNTYQQKSSESSPLSLTSNTLSIDLSGCYNKTETKKKAIYEKKRKEYWNNLELSREKGRLKYSKWVSTKQGNFLNRMKNYRRRQKVRDI